MAAAVLSAAALILGAAAPWAPAQQRAQSATPGDTALAARFAELAREPLQTKNLSRANWDACAAMLRAANRLTPGDARYPRYLVDAEVRIGDRDATIDALKLWLKASPTNISAQTQLVDLYVAGLESSDAKLEYLRAIIGKPPVGELIRSHAAARAARILLERSETDQAAKTLAEALRLNPLNVDALRLRLQMVAATGTPLERTTAMLALLRANPVQPAVMAMLARQVADVGLPQASLEWYYLAGATGARTGNPPTPAFVAGYIGELFIAGQVDPAQKLADQVLAANPNEVEVWFIKLAMDKAAAAPTYEETKKKAGVALSNRLAEIRTAHGQKGATTRPVDTGPGLEVPDLAGDLNQVKAMVSDDARNAYVSVLADIAWYQVCYLGQPVTPGVMDFLRQSLPADGVTLARLDGWNALAQGKSDEAKVKLSAVADRDPLAKLGMIRLAGKDAAAQDAAHADARKLVNDNPSGLLGAMLWAELKGPAVQILKTPQAEAIEAELSRFPRDLLKILDTPQEFYAVRGEPPQIAHAYGEPLDVNVTIQNLSDYDLTVGPDGVIRPDLWFDARLRGGIDQQVAGVAFDRIADAGVLKARQSISQTVRLDQDMFGRSLAQNPSMSVQVYAGVMTNPQPAQNGLSAGPAGYRVQFPRVMERQATAIGSEALRQKLYNLVATGNGGEKIRTMEVLAAYVQLIRTNKDVTKEALAVAEEMANAIRTGMSDQEASVQAFATYMSALIGPSDQLPKALQQMMTDKSWQKRLLALTAVPALSPDQRTSLPTDLGANDADEVVQAYAKAQAELRAIAATQPAATQPAEAPAPAAK